MWRLVLVVAAGAVAAMLARSVCCTWSAASRRALRRRRPRSWSAAPAVPGGSSTSSASWTLVAFTAPTCEICKVLLPGLRALDRTYREVELVQVDHSPITADRPFCRVQRPLDPLCRRSGLGWDCPRPRRGGQQPRAGRGVGSGVAVSGRRPWPLTARLNGAGQRWTAARQSRPSFLGRFGKAAVLVAAGPSLAAVLAHSAEARERCQSGVSPRCSNFDCLLSADSVWGWRRYASDGCCRNGGLKKICDCRTQGWPEMFTGTAPPAPTCAASWRAAATTAGQATVLARDGSLRFQLRRSGSPDEVPGVAPRPRWVMPRRSSASRGAPVAGVLAAPFRPRRLHRPDCDRARGAPFARCHVRSCRRSRSVPLRDSLRDQGFEIEVVGSSGDLEHFAEQTAVLDPWRQRRGPDGDRVDRRAVGRGDRSGGGLRRHARFPGTARTGGGERVGLPTRSSAPSFPLTREPQRGQRGDVIPVAGALLIELAELAYASRWSTGAV